GVWFDGVADQGALGGRGFALVGLGLGDALNVEEAAVLGAVDRAVGDFERRLLVGAGGGGGVELPAVADDQNSGRLTRELVVWPIVGEVGQGADVHRARGHGGSVGQLTQCASAAGGQGGGHGRYEEITAG